MLVILWASSSFLNDSVIKGRRRRKISRKIKRKGQEDNKGKYDKKEIILITITITIAKIEQNIYLLTYEEGKDRGI